jgi:hypothetical protein
MKTQQCGWLEQNGCTPKPTWLNPERKKSSNESISDAEIGRPPSRTVHDQQLMLGQNDFGDDSPQTGLARRITVVMRWTNRMSNSRMAHRIPSKTLVFRAN